MLRCPAEFKPSPIAFKRTSLTSGNILLVFALYACSAEVVTEEELALEVEAAEPQALINGVTISNENYTGIVALQVFVPHLNDYFTFCTGTLMTNSLIITARHCLGDVQDMTVTARMGSQRRTVTARVPHPSIDVAVLELDAGMLMWNWWYDHYTGPAQLNRWEYRRQTYRGTNASLDDKTLTCFGHGGAPNQPPLKIGPMPAAYPTNLTGIGDITLVGLGGTGGTDVSTEDGDSGGPCFDTFSMAGGALSTVHSGDCAPFSTPIPWLCGAVGAADFAYWADLVMYQLATT